MGATISRRIFSPKTDNEPRLSPQQRAIAELDRNGVPWREPIRQYSSGFDDDCDQGGDDGGRADHGDEEFVSKSDAQPMTPDDICNVVFLSAAETREMLVSIADRLGLAVAESDPHAPESTWGNWPDSDARWTLTPHQLRKLRPAGRSTRLR